MRIPPPCASFSFRPYPTLFSDSLSLDVIGPPSYTGRTRTLLFHFACRSPVSDFPCCGQDIDFTSMWLCVFSDGSRQAALHFLAPNLAYSLSSRMDGVMQPTRACSWHMMHGMVPVARLALSSARINCLNSPPTRTICTVLLPPLRNEKKSKTCFQLAHRLRSDTRRAAGILPPSRSRASMHLPTQL